MPRVTLVRATAFPITYARADASPAAAPGVGPRGEGTGPATSPLEGGAARWSSAVVLNWSATALPSPTGGGEEGVGAAAPPLPSLGSGGGG